MLDEYGEEVECLDARYDNECEGEVEYFSPDGRSRAWPRCQKHIEARMATYENSMEKYAYSDVAPSWFDPTYAGERWDDDY